MEIIYEGKSKTVYAFSRKSCIIRFRDTATAFNGEKKEELEGKGKLNMAISNLLFSYLEKNGVKTHFEKVIDESSVLVKRAEIIPIEIIVRNLAAGSFSKKYGIEEGSELKNVALEFSLKDDTLGDPMINISQITAIGIATRAELDKMMSEALTVNKLLTDLFSKAGIKLVDFKLEFGRFNGEVILCDEISPDSCRLWDEKSGKKLDKDRFRRELGGVMESYNEVLRRLLDVKQL